MERVEDDHVTIIKVRLVSVCSALASSLLPSELGRKVEHERPQMPAANGLLLLCSRVLQLFVMVWVMVAHRRSTIIGFARRPRPSPC
jgi:hypothetical protein